MFIVLSITEKKLVELASKRRKIAEEISNSWAWTEFQHIDAHIELNIENLKKTNIVSFFTILSEFKTVELEIIDQYNTSIISKRQFFKLINKSSNLRKISIRGGVDYKEFLTRISNNFMDTEKFYAYNMILEENSTLDDTFECSLKDLKAEGRIRGLKVYMKIANEVERIV